MTDTFELMVADEERILMDLLGRDEIPDNVLLQLSEDSPYFPEIEVQLSGRDGNAGVVIGAVAAALRRNNVPSEAIDRFRKSCFAGDYDGLLQTAMRWVETA